MSDGEHGQYSTNLDRNRYGNDDQYLFTGAAGASIAGAVVGDVAGAEVDVAAAEGGCNSSKRWM